MAIASIVDRLTPLHSLVGAELPGEPELFLMQDRRVTVTVILTLRQAMEAWATLKLVGEDAGSRSMSGDRLGPRPVLGSGRSSYGLG